MTGEDESTTWRQITPAPQAVAASASGACWSVEECHWRALRPGLPAEMAALLAPPIVVSAVPVAAAVPAAWSGLTAQVTLAAPTRRVGRGSRAARPSAVRPATRSSGTRQRRAVPTG